VISNLMISKLPQIEYQKVLPLFIALDHYLIINAVIDGTSPGEVYVDDREDPKAAMLCSAEGYFFAGNEKNTAFNNLLAEHIRSEINQGNIASNFGASLSYDFYPEAWRKRLGVIFNSPPVAMSARHYVCKELKYDWRRRIPEDYSIERIDYELLERPSLIIPDHMDSKPEDLRAPLKWMETHWGSIENFMTNGFGFCTLYADEIVSWCMTDCVSSTAVEVGIYTLPVYRRHGLATFTVAATVDYGFSQGFSSIGWHCDRENTGSIRVAEKVGFEKERDYVYYYSLL
jgi:RimJ/RimL family protein N-acetyltransferase